MGFSVTSSKLSKGSFPVHKKDGVVKASPACHRAVLETVEALRKVGHECVEIDPPDGAVVQSSLLPLKADGGLQPYKPYGCSLASLPLMDTKT